MPNIIGDIAGQYKTLQALLKKMPDDEPISVGDMIDRGPDSDKVVQFFMNNGNAVMGNHEHLLIDHIDELGIYSDGIWQYNGGTATQMCYGHMIPQEVMNWLVKRPIYLTFGETLISHAFICENKYPDLLLLPNLMTDQDMIWNRKVPKRRSDYKLQIAGHNSHFGLKHFRDEQGLYALGIDTSAERVLTGIHLPSMLVYEQEYI